MAGLNMEINLHNDALNNAVLLKSVLFLSLTSGLVPFLYTLHTSV
jgi:hypothetical protein